MKQRILAAVAVAAATAVAVPVVAYLIVPLFVHRELHEAAPAVASTPATSLGASGAPGTPAGSGPAQPRTLASGDLRRINAVDYGSGRVLVLDTGAGRVLRFEGVDIAGAPDMYVYLSDRADGSPGRFLDLGRLRATTGSFNHDIPSDADLAAVRSVVVWCRQFMTTVTFAPLG